MPYHLPDFAERKTYPYRNNFIKFLCTFTPNCHPCIHYVIALYTVPLEHVPNCSSNTSCLCGYTNALIFLN